jgi:hypothetical protein
MPWMSDRGVPVSFLHELFICDAERGLLTWRLRPNHHFATVRAATIINVRNGGKPAGGTDGRGYLMLTFIFAGRRIKTYGHRVVWAFATGAWPARTIDHRNGDRLDNRLANLREATRAQQNLNMGPRKSETGLRGAYRNGPGFQAKMKHEGKTYRFGQFRTAEEAHAAYLAGRARLNTFQPVPRDG